MGTSSAQNGHALPGQTIVVTGGSAGIGLAPARRARAEGAVIVITGRNPERLAAAAGELGAERTAAAAGVPRCDLCASCAQPRPGRRDSYR